MLKFALYKRRKLYQKFRAVYKYWGVNGRETLQPGHEEVASVLLTDLEVLPAELLDVSNTSAQEMRVRLKQEIRIVCKILFMFYF